MLKKNLNLCNPLKFMGHETDTVLSKGEFGAIMARAGIGKTSLLVQLAISAMLKNKNVLHISLDTPVKKVHLWYKELFLRLSSQYPTDEANQLLEDIIPHRFIMTLQTGGFSLPGLEERITDLKEQNIFSPQIMILDGLPFDSFERKQLVELKSLVKNHSMYAWFTIRTHRHESPAQDGIPAQLEKLADIFEVLIQLQPGKNEIHVKVLKGGPDSDHPVVLMDPSTMLIKGK